MKRRLLSIALCIAIAASFASVTGCQNSDLNSDKSGEEDTEAGISYPLTLTDAYGNEVTVESEPETIVSVSPALTEIVYALGGQDKLIGRSDYDDYPEEVFDIQSVGPIDLPDTELIVSLDPDVVLASSIFSEEAFNTLIDAGITVVIIKDENDLDGMYTYVETTADVIGLHNEGQELISSLKDQLDAIEADAQSIANDDISVYYCMSYGEFGDYTAGSDTFINDIIEAAGCVNAASDAEGWSYSAEQLLEKDPDIILVAWWGYDDFLVTEPYSELTAVKTGNVIPVDNNIFERVGPRNVEAVSQILDAALALDAADAVEDAA